jgi:ribosomal protein L32E
MHELSVHYPGFGRDSEIKALVAGRLVFVGSGYSFPTSTRDLRFRGFQEDCVAVRQDLMEKLDRSVEITIERAKP